MLDHIYDGGVPDEDKTVTDGDMLANGGADGQLDPTDAL
jgi:hypothetical protein